MRKAEQGFAPAGSGAGDAAEYASEPTTSPTCDAMPYCLIRKFVHRGAPRKVVFYAVLSGSLIKFSGNEEMLRQRGVQVDILEDPVGIALVAKYFGEKPEQQMEDARELAAVRKASAPKA
jgi:hypothetical protein